MALLHLNLLEYDVAEPDNLVLLLINTSVKELTFSQNMIIVLHNI